MFIKEIYNFFQKEIFGYNKLIIPTPDLNRCSGKTSFLIERALEEDGIYIGTKASCVYAKHVNPKIKTQLYNTINSIPDYVPIFIDEGVDFNIEDLKRFKRIIAFQYNHFKVLD